MLARVFTCAVVGLDGVVVEVEVDTSNGLPTINLAPAAVRKEGPVYDLPIAVGILAATEQLPADALDKALIIGELSLDGGVRHVSGVLPLAAMARSQGFDRIFVPEVDAPEAALIPDVEVIPVSSLRALHEHLSGGVQIPPQKPSRPQEFQASSSHTDFQDIKGQEQVKRALEVAASGNHNLLMLWTKGRTFWSPHFVKIRPFEYT